MKKSEPEGSENEMLELINTANKLDLVSEVGINNKQAEAILSKAPFKRVRYIEKLEGTGNKTYSRLFSYYYNKVANHKLSGMMQTPTEYRQLGLFGDSFVNEPTADTYESKTKETDNKE